jgi:hypothetical protein
VGVTPRVDLPSVGENVQEHILISLAFGTCVPLVLLPTLTIHQELKNPENYNTQDPIADEAVLKEQLRL